MDVFDIRLLGFLDRPGKNPVADLSRVFGIGEAKAQAIVARAPILVKRGVDEQTAERFFHLLRGIGADVRLERRAVASIAPGARLSQSPTPPTPSQMPTASQAPIGSQAPSEGIGIDPMPSLPVPDFDALGMDIDRSSSGFPSPMAASVGSVRPAAPSVRPAAPSVHPAAPSVRPDSMRAPSTAPAPSIRPLDPGATDTWFCDACNTSFHELQVKQAAAGIQGRPGLKAMFMCPECKGVVRRVEGETQEPLINRLLGAFMYPIQKGAPSIFAGVALISAIVSLVPFIGAVLSGGVLAIFFFKVIRDSGDGDDTLPKGGEFIDFDDIVAPSVRFSLAMLVPFVPSMLAFYALAETPLLIPAVLVAVLFGLAYMPASVMVAALTSGCLGPLNPVAGVMIMTRVPMSYVLTSIAVGIVLVINTALTAAVYAAAQMIPLPLVPTLIANAVGLVLPTIACRMLGIFLHHHRHELGLGLV